MWCPNCKTEYVEGIEVCHDCQATLVNECPPAEEEQEALAYVPDEWTELEEFADEAAARMAEGLLLENGITCRIEDVTFHAGAVPTVSNMTLYRLWVAPEQADEADRILSTPEDHPDMCTLCGAALPSPNAECPACSENWKDGDTKI